MPLAPGGTFERYAIEALIGRGGMGEVYRATDTRLGRPVALKVLRSDEEGAAATAAAGGVARLLREARSAAAFNHPHSVAIYELGEAEGIPYIAMEFVKGTSLRNFVGSPGTPLATKVGWLVDAARALHAAHRAGLVHRDIKPSNIMISEDGIVKVLDFGLAKPLSAKIDPSGFQTQLGQVLGTPKYMAPEQLDGLPVDAKADQFAFGLVAYELLTGIYPGGPLAPMPKAIDRVVRGAPVELGEAVTRMMARRAPERFPTMEDAANALRAAASRAGNVVEMPATAAKRPSDAPTREVSRPTHKTAPLPAVSLATPSVSPPSREGWNRTQPIVAVQTPQSIASRSVPTAPPPPPGSSGVHSFAPPSSEPRSPRPTFPSQSLVPPQAPAKRVSMAFVAIAAAVLVGLGLLLALLLARR